MTTESQYEDMWYLPYHKSTKHTPMPVSERAGQFSPFAALTGHSDAIQKTADLIGSRDDVERVIIEES